MSSYPPGFVPVYDSEGNITGYEAPTQSYGGGGGYGVSSSPSDTDKKAGKLLSAVVNENAEIIRDTYDAHMQVYDIADEMSNFLAVQRRCQARRKAGNEWYLEQQKLHSAAMQLADVAANALNSSLTHDFREMLSRVDDQADAEVLKNMRENLQDINIDLAEALMATINSRNDLSANTEQQLRQLFTDWLAQLINIHPDLLADEDFTPTGTVIVDGDADVPAQANIPGWINYEQFFEERVKGAIQPEDAPLARPDSTATRAWALGRLKDIFEIEGASDPAYWLQVQEQSERKTQ